MGYLGTRFSAYQLLHKERLANPLLDIEGGLGAGVGGEINYEQEEDATDGRRWWKRAAIGGYFGVGGGVELNFHRDFKFSLYLRSRVQLSRAINIPLTVWYTVGAGFEFTILRYVKIYNGHYFGMYDDVMDREVGYVTDVGLKFVFDIF